MRRPEPATRKSENERIQCCQELPLETAIDLAGRGWPVLPVFSDRSAALPNWPHKATTDLDQIKRWFSEGYYLVGMLTGPRSGVDVLDVDPRNGGDKWLEENAHLIPETRRQTTSRGGYHYFFRHHPGLKCSESRIAPGVDVRAEGGYVVVWASAGFALIDADIADWPPDLLAKAVKTIPERQRGRFVAASASAFRGTSHRDAQEDA